MVEMCGALCRIFNVRIETQKIVMVNCLAVARYILWQPNWRGPVDAGPLARKIFVWGNEQCGVSRNIPFFVDYRGPE